MEERNVDLEIPLRREQWEEIGQRAAALEKADGDFEWADDRDRIVVYLKNEETPAMLRDLVSAAGAYGNEKVQIAEFVFNDGRPYADLNAPSTSKPPTILPQADAARDVELERVVRDKWHRLLEESGLHFEFGHVSPEVD